MAVVVSVVAPGLTADAYDAVTAKVMVTNFRKGASFTSAGLSRKDGA